MYSRRSTCTPKLSRVLHRYLIQSSFLLKPSGHWPNGKNWNVDEQVAILRGYLADRDGVFTLAHYCRNGSDSGAHVKQKTNPDILEAFRNTLIRKSCGRISSGIH